MYRDKVVILEIVLSPAYNEAAKPLAWWLILFRSSRVAIVYTKYSSIIYVGNGLSIPWYILKYAIKCRIDTSSPVFSRTHIHYVEV